MDPVLAVAAGNTRPLGRVNYPTAPCLSLRYPPGGFRTPHVNEREVPMLTLKNTFKVACACVLFTSGLAATGLAMAVVGLFLVGLVDWTGASQAARVKSVPGATEDVRAEYLAQPEPKARSFSPTQISERSPR